MRTVQRTVFKPLHGVCLQLRGLCLQLHWACLQLHWACLQLHAQTVRSVHVMPRLLRNGRQVWLHRGHHQMRVLSVQGWMPGMQGWMPGMCQVCAGHLLRPVQVNLSCLHRVCAVPHLRHLHRLCW
jgi:hypothetical protein